MAHPAVAQALAFALPHPALGEDVAAAVVLKPGAITDERALRAHVAARLAYFKIPRRVVIVPALPLGPSGKPQRLGLAQRLGLVADVAASVGPVGTACSPRSPVEEIVASLWTELVGARPPSVDADFFACGGDSIGMLRLVARLAEQLAIEIALIDVLDAPTVHGMAIAVEAALAREGA